MQVAARDTQIAGLGDQLEQLGAQVADLAARVSKNSKNSSKPPSQDGLGKPSPRSMREKTGRGPGRPKGQPGVTMELTDHPDHVIRHEPGCCAGCGAGLGGAAVTGMERRQVTEIPPVKAEVTEHQMIERQCGCGTRTRADAPAGVNAPVQYGPRASALATYLWHGQFLSREQRERRPDVWRRVRCRSSCERVHRRMMAKIGRSAGSRARGMPRPAGASGPGSSR